MDGIVTGLTSVIPIMPDNSIITDKSGVNGPPVEIMPLPQNSFMSEDATAQMLNNPYKLSLDANGNGGGAQGGRTGASEIPAADSMLGDAYNLTLGTKDGLQTEADTALDVSRYEMLGKSAARQAYRLNPETGAAEAAAAQTPEKESSAISEKVRILSQAAALQNEAPQPEAQSRTAAAPDARRAGVLNPGVLRLTASDLEVFTTLESDLQEALLNMLRGENVVTSADQIPTQNMRTGEDVIKTRAPAGIPERAEGQAGKLVADLQNLHLSIDSGAARAGTVITNMLRQPPLSGNATDAARAVILSDEQALIAAAVMTSERTRGANPANTLEGSMENLRKINELPFALYLFGNVTAEKCGETEEEDGLEISGKTKHTGPGPKEFLRLSEAVKMAAVLHNIYYGGSGKFEQEKPWYAAYERYALKNGIIQNGEFEDLNELATRAETAHIFSNCVPRAELTTVNHIINVPDVLENIGYGDRIYLLLRAGVLSIGDNKGFFYPEKIMTKTEAAIIIGRIASPSDRKKRMS